MRVEVINNFWHETGFILNDTMSFQLTFSCAIWRDVDRPIGLVKGKVVFLK